MIKKINKRDLIQTLLVVAIFVMAVYSFIPQDITESEPHMAQVDQLAKLDQGSVIKMSKTPSNKYYVCVRGEDSNGNTIEEVWQVAPRTYRTIELTDTIQKDDVTIE